MASQSLQRLGLLCALALPLFLTACDSSNDDSDASGERIVDVEGVRLRAVVTGEGSPAVVFVSGLGDGVAPWQQVAPDAAARTTAVTYARPGTDGSAAPAPAGWTPTSLVVSEQLRGLLAALDVGPPVVLVGHSIGGLHARVYASTYPGDVAGLVLVDPLHEDTIDSLAVGLTPEQRAEFEAAWDAAAAGMPPAMAAEFLASRTSFQQAQAASPLPDVPTVVLTSMKLGEGDTPEAKDLARRLHARYLTGLAEGRHVITATAGHYIQLEEPALVRDALGWVLDRVR